MSAPTRAEVVPPASPPADPAGPADPGPGPTVAPAPASWSVDERVDAAPIQTSVRLASWLSPIFGVNVWLKLECHQRTGSFKYRGAMEAVRRVGPTDLVVTASAGNHALAIAQAARVHRNPVAIFLPHSATDVKRRRLSDQDIAIYEVGASLDEAIDFAIDFAARHGGRFISPYDDDGVHEGQSTIADELGHQLDELDLVMVPVGGGGLLRGLQRGFDRAGRSVELLGCQPTRFSPFRQANITGGRHRSVHRRSLADGLILNAVEGSSTLSGLDDVTMVEVGEEAIAAAMYMLLHNESILAEGAGAIGLAALLQDPGLIGSAEDVCVVVSGGNVTSGDLAHALTFPFTTPSIRRLLGLQGSPPGDRPLVRGPRPTGSAPAPSLAPREQADEALRAAARLAEDLLAFERAEDLDRPRASTSYVRQSLEAVRGLIDDAATWDEAPEHAQEDLLRLVLSASAHLSAVAEWQSPTYDQAVRSSQNSPADNASSNVNYARYQSRVVREKEQMIRAGLGFDPSRVGALLTSSGMAAYTLIESYLLREVLETGSIVTVPGYIYFEAFEQLRSLSSIDVRRYDGLDQAGYLDFVEATQPAVVFADPLTNTAELRLWDMAGFIRELSSRITRDRVHLVIDGTMLSGAFDPFPLNADPRLEVLYYESGSKYLQLGLDLGLTGVVVAPLELSEVLERLRRNGGQILLPEVARRIPDYDRERYLRRMGCLHRNAMLASETFLARGDDVPARPVYPGHPTHADAAHAGGYLHLGGVMTFEFDDVGLNQAHLLNASIRSAINLCRERRLPLTQGVSFGFRSPRISASSAMAEDSPPFLRLSVGAESEDTTEAVAEAIADAMSETAAALRRLEVTRA